MNRISELQTIVKVSKICNNNGLTKEADQLLNIFTKLAQENPDLIDPNQTQDLKNLETIETETVQPEEQQMPKVDQELIDQLDDFIKSFDQLMIDLTKDSSFEETKQLLPELTRIIDLARVIFNNPNLESGNKKTLSESLPELVKIQEVLKK
jgi:parvulin-like peptidyl-prolyl isomerase